jgi:hypothetical protein
MALLAHWKTHIDAWQNSGLSQAAYCRQHQLTYPTFSARLCEFRAQAKLSPPAPPVLLPIQVQPPPIPNPYLTHTINIHLKTISCVIKNLRVALHLEK